MKGSPPSPGHRGPPASAARNKAKSPPKRSTIAKSKARAAPTKAPQPRQSAANSKSNKVLATKAPKLAAKAPKQTTARGHTGKAAPPAKKATVGHSGPSSSVNAKAALHKAMHVATEAKSGVKMKGNSGASPGVKNGATVTEQKLTVTAGNTTATQASIVLPEKYRPSDSEPFMNLMQRQYFKIKLLNWREEIQRQTRETLQVMLDDTIQYADLADRATSETDRALELRARDRQRKLVAKIDAALARIEDGSYGYCEETGEPIGLKRLDARPIATLSLEAQERHERRERVHRGD